MGIKFLHTSIKQFDRLCNEEEKVVISINCYKTEETVHPDGSITLDDVLTSGWGVQIKTWKDIFQIDDEDDYPDKNALSDKVKESLR